MAYYKQRNYTLVAFGFGTLLICGYLWCNVSAESAQDESSNFKVIDDSELLRSKRSAEDVTCKNVVKKVRRGKLKRHCQIYNRTNNGGVCRKYLGHDLLFAHSDYQAKAESNVVLLTKILSSIVTLLRIRIPGRCRRALIESACRQEIPLCDLSKRQPRPLRMCRSSCDFVIQQKCGDVLKRIETVKKSREQELFIQRFQIYIKSRCEELPSQYGSNYIPCYSIFNKERYAMIPGSEQCYDGNSIKYTGSISKTASGRLCQPWKSQCPHRHPFTLSRYPELFDAENNCRDPGGIRGRPWCYINDGKTRWQFCNIQTCSDKQSSTTVKTTNMPTTKHIMSTTIDCKGEMCHTKSATNNCEQNVDGKCKISEIKEKCQSDRICSNDITSSQQIRIENEDNDIGLKPWIVYLLIAVGGIMSVCLFLIVLLKVKQKRKQKDFGTGETSLASNYDSVSAIDDEDDSDDDGKKSCLKLSKDTSVNCIDTEMTIDDIDPRLTVQV